MLSNPIFLEILIKEYQKELIEEAKMLQLKFGVNKNNKRKPFFDIERFADLLIYVGEYLKVKYCSKTAIPFYL